MKKALILVSVVCLVALFASQVFAWGGRGMNNGYGGNCGMAYGCAPCEPGSGPGMTVPAEPVVKSADEAKELVQKYISENLKGYKVGAVQSFTMPRGTMYQVESTDAGGNKFFFHVNPWGNVVGPFRQ